MSDEYIYAAPVERKIIHLDGGMTLNQAVLMLSAEGYELWAKEAQP